MKARFRRLFESLISKNILAWIVGCFFLRFDKISGTDWVLLTGAVFGLILTQQVFAPKEAPSVKPVPNLD